MTDDELKSLRYAGEAREIAAEIATLSGGKRRISFYVALMLVAQVLEDECPALARSRQAIFGDDEGAAAEAMAMRARAN